MPEEEFDTIKQILDLKEISMEALVKYALLQALKLQTEDLQKFSLAVENIESLLIDEIEEDYERCKKENRIDESYIEKVKLKWEELEKEYGKREEFQAVKLKEFSQFKFRELMKLIKKRIPIEAVGVI